MEAIRKGGRGLALCRYGGIADAVHSCDIGGAVADRYRRKREFSSGGGGPGVGAGDI